MRGICTDNPGIENLISKGLVYVDKTDVLHAFIGCNYNPVTRNLDRPEIENLEKGGKTK